MVAKVTIRHTSTAQLQARDHPMGSLAVGVGDKNLYARSCDESGLPTWVLLNPDYPAERRLYGVLVNARIVELIEAVVKLG